MKSEFTRFASATVDDDDGAIRTSDLEPPTLQDDAVAAVEGHVVVGGGDRACRRVERHPFDLGHRFCDAERDREIDDQRDSRQSDQQIPK